jgi:ribosomal protein S8
MHSIFLNSENKALSFSSFQEKLVEICNSHRENNKALAFAFILYDFENAQIQKVLNDKDYWLALNKISGEYLSVFSINYKAEDEGMEKISNLTTFSYNDNPSIATNKLIENYFVSNLIVTYPAILFFQVKEKEVIDSLLIELKEEKIEEAFLELKENMKITVDVLKKVHEENKRNFKEIFDLVENELRANKNSSKIKRVKKDAGNIIGLASSVIGIL